MSKHTISAPETEVIQPEPPLLATRGLRREQAKRARRRARIGPDTLIVGVDLARERQAFSFARGTEIVGRKRADCAPEDLAQLLPEAKALGQRLGLDRLLFAFEPAGHYWRLAAEALERCDTDYVLVHPIAVKREREVTRYTPEKTDPRDADLIAILTAEGKFTEIQLPRCRERAACAQLARGYFRTRTLAAAERSRLSNLWDQLLPEFFTVLRDPSCATALAVARALGPLSELASLTPRRWLARVRKAATGERILLSRVAPLLPLLKAAHADLVRRSGEGLPIRIRHAAERRVLLQQQKQQIRDDLLARYARAEESTYLDSIPGSSPFYNALVLAVVGDYADFDSPRAIVKLAGTEINHYASGDWAGTSRMSHRGRSMLRAAAYQQSRLLVAASPEFKDRYYRLLHRTERRRLAPLQCSVAVMNAYLRLTHVLVTRRELYRPVEERVRQEVAMH